MNRKIKRKRKTDGQKKMKKTSEAQQQEKEVVRNSL